jgi:hypothetical protein
VILAVSPGARAPVPSGGFPLYLDFVSARIAADVSIWCWEFCRLDVNADNDQAWMRSPQIIPLIFCCSALLI